MKKVAVTQRVDISSPHKERRDALDQRWCAFLNAANLSPLILPNNIASSTKLLSTEAIEGILLTGGNDLEAYGGDAKERDELEQYLLRWGMENCIPILGVCRGMQMIQQHFGVKLQEVSGHISASQEVIMETGVESVNSYHRYGSFESNEDLPVWAQSCDGLVKAIRSKEHAIMGLMWHPERLEPFRARDLELFADFFGSQM